MIVLDASVYVAMINRHEPHHDVSWSWFAKVRELKETLIAPSIIVAETAAAIRRAHKEPQLAYRVVRRLMNSRMIELVPISLSLSETAANIAIAHQIRGCDSIYVALAQQNKAQLVTLDRQQLERSQSIISAITPHQIDN